MYNEGKIYKIKNCEECKNKIKKIKKIAYSLNVLLVKNFYDMPSDLFENS